MQRFRFRLETALRLRHLAETEALGALGEAERAVAAAEASLTDALEERTRHDAYCARLVERPGADLELIRAASRYTEVLVEGVEAVRADLRAAVAERERRFDELLARRRDREALERLRARRADEHRRAAESAEQAQLDEAALLRFGRGA